MELSFKIYQLGSGTKVEHVGRAMRGKKTAAACANLLAMPAYGVGRLKYKRKVQELE